MPAIVTPGCLDMVNFGEPQTVPTRFQERRFYRHNPQVTLMRTTTLCHLAQIAIDTGAKLRWNPDTERFVGNDDANELLDRPHRAPWKIEGCL